METETPGPKTERTTKAGRGYEFVVRWFQQAAGVMVAGWLVPGLRWERAQDLALAAFLLATLHTFVRPILFLVSLPLVVLTLGLFMIVINAGLLMAVSSILRPRFEVDSFGSACWGGVAIGFVAMFIKVLLSPWKGRIRVSTTRPATKVRDPRQGPPSGPVGGGPIIDV